MLRMDRGNEQNPVRRCGRENTVTQNALIMMTTESGSWSLSFDRMLEFSCVGVRQQYENLGKAVLLYRALQYPMKVYVRKSLGTLHLQEIQKLWRH